jgi:hypothetical protein
VTAPNEAGDPWTSLMRRGDFEGAWRICDRLLGPLDPGEWRRPRHVQRVWDGRSFAGRHVLIRCYHGLGDTIQFLRYVPHVAAVARDVSLWIQPALVPLVESTPGLSRVQPLHDGDPDIAPDVDVEIMELPHALRTTVETIPSRIPYLRVPEARAPSSSQQPRIGLAWKAGPWDPRRSMPGDIAARMVRGAACEVIVLQHEFDAVDRSWARPSGCDTLADVAACVASLDLVITVDTVFAHLAGALGRPAWVLLHADPDWRWMTDRDDSPWYPTVRLYRQPAPNDWSAVVTRVARDLREWLDAFGRAHV